MKEETDGAVHIRTVTKNNQTEMDVFVMAGEKERVQPLIDIRDIYELYETEPDMEGCINWLLAKQKGTSFNERFKDIENWECCKDKIVFYIINHEWNEKMLETVPHRDYLNLAIAFRVDIEDDMSSLVTQGLMECWNVDMRTLWDSAMKNLQEEKFHIISILELVMGIFDDNIRGNCRSDTKKYEDSVEMYVMINDKRSLGARCILRPELLKEFADEHDANLFLLPSSLHEFIIIPVSKKWNVLALQNMVTDINAREVAAEERLSNKVYHYDRVTGEISIGSVFSY